MKASDLIRELAGHAHEEVGVMVRLGKCEVLVPVDRLVYVAGAKRRVRLEAEIGLRLDHGMIEAALLKCIDLDKED